MPISIYQEKFHSQLETIILAFTFRIYFGDRL
jgi:hypothetical protein